MCELKSEKETVMDRIHAIKIEDLECSVRLGRMLRELEFKTVGDILEYSKVRFARVPNFGSRCRNELDEILFGLSEKYFCSCYSC